MMVTTDNKKLIKICERELSELEKMKPVDVDDLDLSKYDPDTRETIIKTIGTMEQSITERINHWKSLIKELKGE